jgi:hypothetical protein
MSKFLRKSWRKNPKTETAETESLSDKFEKEVMRNAKGSIATVLRNTQPAARNPARDQPSGGEHASTHEESHASESEAA